MTAQLLHVGFLIRRGPTELPDRRQCSAGPLVTAQLLAAITGRSPQVASSRPNWWPETQFPDFDG